MPKPESTITITKLFTHISVDLELDWIRFFFCSRHFCCCLEGINVFGRHSSLTVQFKIDSVQLFPNANIHHPKDRQITKHITHKHKQREKKKQCGKREPVTKSNNRNYASPLVDHRYRSTHDLYNSMLSSISFWNKISMFATKRTRKKSLFHLMY